MTPEPSLPPASPPRLRTAHWFLLSALCGLVAAVRVGWTRGLDIPQEYLAYVAVSNFGVALILGGAATGLVIVMARRWRGLHHERPAPGYFLLLYVVVGYPLVGGITFSPCPSPSAQWPEQDVVVVGNNPRLRSAWPSAQRTILWAKCLGELSPRDQLP